MSHLHKEKFQVLLDHDKERGRATWVLGYAAWGVGGESKPRAGGVHHPIPASLRMRFLGFVLDRFPLVPQLTSPMLDERKRDI